MSIDLHYIPLFTLEEVFLDKDTALPMAGGIVTFYEDLQRQTPKSVFMLSGNPPDYTFTDLGNQLILGISGTFVDDNGDPFVPYAYPFDADGNVQLYYVTVENSGNIAQFIREAVPYVNTADTPATEAGNNENELCNPQFVEVNIASIGSVILNVTGTNTVTPIAPGWDFISTGTGTITVERLQPTAASVPTNPPYILTISASASLGSSITLRQRLNNTPTLFRGLFASGSLTASIISGGASNISMVYAPTSGISTTIIASTPIPNDGAYHTIEGNAALPDQTNTAADSGYIDINFIIPASRVIGITSLQLVGSATAQNIGFDEQSADRQKDHLFHYYEDAAVHQPKTNLLTGWTFAQNPWQSYSITHGNVATNEYTADQTVIIQQAYVASATGNNVAVTQGTAAQKHGYIVTAVTAANKFALLQYIHPDTVRPFWSQKLSVMFRASAIIDGAHTTVPRFKVRLIYRVGLPVTIAQTNPVSSWNDVDDDIPGLAGWTYITAGYDPTYTLTSTVQDFKFDGFQLPASSNDNMTLGIIFIMMNDLDSAGTADKILFERVSLVNSDFAVTASAETFDESLRKCQYYYETSYNQGLIPGAVTENGAVLRNVRSETGGGNVSGYAIPFDFDFNTIKCTNTTPAAIVLYSTAGTINNVTAAAYTNYVARGSADAPSSRWDNPVVGQKRASYVAVSGTALIDVGDGASTTQPFADIRFHYAINSRLGKA